MKRRWVPPILARMQNRNWFHGFTYNLFHVICPFHTLQKRINVERFTEHQNESKLLTQLLRRSQFASSDPPAARLAPLFPVQALYPNPSPPCGPRAPSVADLLIALIDLFSTYAQRATKADAISLL
jgi:hypothetical protein